MDVWGCLGSQLRCVRVGYTQLHVYYIMHSSTPRVQYRVVSVWHPLKKIKKLKKLKKHKYINEGAGVNNIDIISQTPVTTDI